jgi:hypothetical protein
MSMNPPSSRNWVPQCLPVLQELIWLSLSFLASGSAIFQLSQFSRIRVALIDRAAAGLCRHVEKDSEAVYGARRPSAVMPSSICGFGGLR